MRSYSFSFSHRSSVTGSVRGRLAFMEKAVFGRLTVCFRSTFCKSIFGVNTMLASSGADLPVCLLQASFRAFGLPIGGFIDCRHSSRPERPDSVGGLRSEEHTSELQSLR